MSVYRLKMNYDNETETITVFDESSSLEIHIRWGIKNIVKYVLSDCKGKLTLTDGVCDDEDDENEEIEWVGGDYIITYENNTIKISVENLTYWDRKFKDKIVNCNDQTNQLIKNKVKSCQKEIIMSDDDYKKNWYDILKKINPYCDLPELMDTKLLWHWGYYDGPLTGICNFNTRKYYCSLVKYPIYSVHYLSDDEIDDVQEYHQLCKTYLGANEYFYDENGVANFNRSSNKPSTYDYDKFVELSKNKKTDYSANEVVGWFILN